MTTIFRQIDSGAAEAAAVWPIHVINLDRVPARMRRMERHLTALGLPFRRHPALDGPRLPPALREAATHGAPRWKRTLTPSEVGCYLSHLALWTAIARGPHPVAIVLEDDAKLLASAPEALVRLTRMEPDWDILKLCHDGPALPGDPLRAVLPARMPPCTTGYAITRAAAARLAERMLPFGRPIDCDLKYWWEHGACVKVTAAPLGGPWPDHRDTSTLDEDRRGQPRPAAMPRLLANVRLQMQRAGASLWHRRGRPDTRQWPDGGPVAPRLDGPLADLLAQR